MVGRRLRDARRVGVPQAPCQPPLVPEHAGEKPQTAGDRAAARDFNPVARALLELHPLAFPLAALVGLIVLSLILRTWTNRNLAHALAFAVTFAQSVAAAGWLIHFGAAGCVAAVLLLIVAERLLAWGHLRESARTCTA